MSIYRAIDDYNIQFVIDGGDVKQRGKVMEIKSKNVRVSCYDSRICANKAPESRF